MITGAVAAGSEVERGGSHVDDDPGRSLGRVRTGKEHEQVTAAVFVYVALDEAGRPRPVPPLAS